MANLLQRKLATRPKPDVPTFLRANEPLGGLIERMGLSNQRGPEWANSEYGNYYATTVPVYRAVKLRADAVARARLKVFRVLPDGEEFEFAGNDNPVQRLLDNVNPWWSPTNLWRATETYLSLWGSAFTWVNRVTNDPAQWELWPLRPDKVAVVRDKAQYVRGFIFDPMGIQFAMLPEEVIWHRYFNPLDEHAGLSPIASMRLVADMRNDMLRTNRELFRNGVLMQNMAFVLKGAVDQYELDEFHERLNDRYSGASKGNKPLVLQQDLADIKNLGFSNREMEWLEGLSVTRTEILTALGIPEELLPGSKGTTFSNKEEARREFYSNTITQEWTGIEGDIQETFIRRLPAEFRGLVARFDKDGIEALEENLDQRSERKRAELAAGAISIDEFRQAVGEDELPGGAGRVHLIPSMSTPVPVDQLGADTGADQGAVGAGFTLGLKAGIDDETVWRQFIERTDAQEDDFATMQRRLFEQQRTDVIRELRRQHRKNEPNAFDEAAWVATYTQVGREVFEQVLEANARAQIAEFSLGVDFNLENPVTQTWIDERTLFWAEHVNEETGKLLLEEIQAGVSEGESIRDLEKRVNRVFDFGEVRTERIARTEVNAAANQGHLDAYRAATIPFKAWITTRDGREREKHASADGQVVERDQPFTVGGEELMMPGQGGSGGNVINCRCTTKPVLTRED